MSSLVDRRAPHRRFRRVGRADEPAILRQLWADQVAHAAARGGTAESAYLEAHFAMDITLDRHLRAIDEIAPFVSGRVLEWGCRHALDSCVYRMRLRDRVELHGCDVCDPDDYRPFHAFSGLVYQRLHHHYMLDYSDSSFDVVTSNGVLEHVHDDVRSVAEVYRVLKPGGMFLVTCLPNRYSYTEALQRLRRARAHDRLYTLKGASALLRNGGFEVTAARRFLMLPTMLNGFPAPLKAAYDRAGPLVWAVNDVLERAWPLCVLASNLMLVARKPGAAQKCSVAATSTVSTQAASA
jgi:SAM-dependent methyltransferase